MQRGAGPGLAEALRAPIPRADMCSATPLGRAPWPLGQPVSSRGGLFKLSLESYFRARAVALWRLGRRQFG